MNEWRSAVERWILCSVMQGVLVLDRGGQLIYVNQYCEKLFGWEARSVLGQRGLMVLVADIDRTAGTSILELVSKGNTWSGLFRMKKLSGELMQTFMTASPIVDVSGTVVATHATIVEIGRLHLPPGTSTCSGSYQRIAITSPFRLTKELHMVRATEGVPPFASVEAATWPINLSIGDCPGAQDPSVQGLSIALLASRIFRAAADIISHVWRSMTDWRGRAQEPDADCDSRRRNQGQAVNLRGEVKSPRQQGVRLDWEAHKQQVKSTLADLKLPREHFESRLSPDSETSFGSAEPSPTTLSPIFSSSQQLRIRRTSGVGS